MAFKADIRVSTFIDRPPEAVFDAITDPANHLRWEPRAAATRWLTEGGMRLGARIETTGQGDQGPLTAIDEVVELERPHVLATRNLTSPVKVVVRWTCEATGAGTELTRRSIMGRTKVGLMRLFRPLTVLSIESEAYNRLRLENEAGLARIKADLESALAPGAVAPLA